MDQPWDTSPTVDRARLSAGHAAQLLRLGAEPAAGSEPARMNPEAPWMGGTVSVDEAGRPIAGIHGPIGRAGARITLLVVASAGFLAIGSQESVRNLPNRSAADGSVSRGLRPASRATPVDPGAGPPNSETRSMQKQFMGVAALGAALAVADASHAQAVQWRVEDGGNGHWYRLVPEARNWPDARDRAVSLGGHLATLTSQGEANFVIPIGTAHAWLGASTPPSQGCNLSAWSWVTGEPWSFTYWAGGEPGNCAETALAFASWGGYSGRWNNSHQTVVPTGFLVEWSADCNDDGVVDYGQILSGQLADSNNDGIPNVCECPCDVFGDNAVNGIDLGVLLGQWGPANQYTVTDFNGDGAVDGLDLGTLLAAWGPCPN